ncbi:hypothetical protein LTR53_015970 [Teratosphaeriaceae sp. CCFEE 6253]|nr:hypothetical protein LTR53_015970 [Teratosphaeriaceae sp. CCFEE 6253]
MLAAALKRGARSSESPKQTTAVQQLHQFLDFYSAFPYHTRGVTLEPTTKLFKKHPASDFDHNQPALIQAAEARGDPIRAGQWAMGVVRPLQPYLLCVQDPADPRNDLGRKSNAVKHFVVVCGQLRPRLRDRKDLSVAGIQRLLNHIVSSTAVLDSGRRERIEAYGKEVLEKEASRAMAVDEGRGEMATGAVGEVDVQAAGSMSEEERARMERQELEELREMEREEMEKLRAAWADSVAAGEGGEDREELGRETAAASS